MSDAQAWNRLTDLVTADPRVAPFVRRAVEDPEGYLADHEEALAERGIEEADEVSPLIALIDALLETGELAYLDWKAETAEVTAHIAALPRVRATGIDLGAVVDAELLEDAVRAVNGLLAPASLEIVMLDEDSDAYPLVAVPADATEAVTEAAQAVDVEVQSF